VAQAFAFSLKRPDFDILWSVSEHPGDSRYDFLDRLGMGRQTVYPRVAKLEQHWFLMGTPVSQPRPGRGTKTFELTAKGQMAAVGVLASRPSTARAIDESNWLKRPLPWYLLPKESQELEKGSPITTTRACILEFYWWFFHQITHNPPLKAALANSQSLEDIGYIWSALIVAGLDTVQTLAKKHGMAIPEWTRSAHDWGARVGRLAGEPQPKWYRKG
jgi:DNA-binding PadR family transcriptional regulator